jgi:capsular polysaccharide biosynthesis protein
LLEDGCRLVNFIKQNRQKIGTLVVSESTPQAVIEMYNLIAPGYKIHYISESGAIWGKNVTVPIGKTIIYDQPQMSIDSIFIPDKTNLLEYKKIIESKLPNPTLRPSRKIYIQRRSNFRNIIGERSLIEKLIEIGFEIIDLRALSLLEQYNIFSNSKKIIGLAGAAWANLIFANKETKILSLIGQDAAPWDMHQKIAELFGLEYTQLVLKHSLAKKLNYSDFLHRDVKIEFDQLTHILNWANS